MFNHIHVQRPGRRCRNLVAGAMLCCSAGWAIANTVSGIDAVPVKAQVKLIHPLISFVTRLNEAGVEKYACTFELSTPADIRRLRELVVKSVVTAIEKPKWGYEARNKISFFLENGEVAQLVFSKRYTNADTIDADWNGVPALLPASFPAEIAKLVKAANSRQLNPEAAQCNALPLE